MKAPLRGRCVVHLVEYRIDGEWQTDGEWFVCASHARDQARDNAKSFGWPWRVHRAVVSTAPAALRGKP